MSEELSQAMSDTIKALTKESFDNLKNKTFSIHANTAIHALELIEVADRGSAPPPDPKLGEFRAPFSLLFKAEKDLNLEQGAYRFENEELGGVNLTMTSVLVEKYADIPLYEVIFV